MTKRPKPGQTPQVRPGGPTAAERRVAAQKAALKANMARRKEQARARDDGSAQPGTEGETK